MLGQAAWEFWPVKRDLSFAMETSFVSYYPIWGFLESRTVGGGTALGWISQYG
jgi:hypothetical protein